MASLNSFTLPEAGINVAVTDIMTAIAAIMDQSDPTPVAVFQSVRRAFTLPLFFEAETITPSCVIWQRSTRYSIESRTNFTLDVGKHVVELYLYLWCPENSSGALDIQVQRERLTQAVLIALRPAACGGLLVRTGSWQYDSDSGITVDHTDTMERHYDTKETQRGWYVTRIDLPVTAALVC